MISEVVLSETVAGVLAEAITATGRRLGGAASSAMRGRRYARDLEIARWFDTYRLTEKVPALPGLSPDAAEELTEVLRGDEVQAVLHELLAARLTDAPEADVARVRAVWDLTLAATGPDVPRVPAARDRRLGAAGPDVPRIIQAGQIDQTLTFSAAGPDVARAREARVRRLGAAGPDAERFTAALFDYYDDEICTLVGTLEGHDPALLGQIRGEAMAARMNATLRAIERHTAALSARPDQRTESDFLARYRQHLADQHGKLEPPDFERRRRVPIADIYVPTSIFQEIYAERERAPRELDLWQLAAEIDRTVLLGDPGGGKTTAANVLLHHFATDDARRLPFLVTLRDFAAHDPPERSVVSHIDHTLETFYQCPPPPGLVDRLLLTGRALVIFDGLDELLDTSRRADVTTRVERFCTEYPLARVLVTSRLIGYDQARLDDTQFARYRLGDFGEEQVGDYVRKWFAQEEGVGADEAARWSAAFMEESASVLDLRASPLLLSLMCILYRGEGSLPRDRAEIYGQCASLLFRKWDARRKIHLDLRAGHLIEPALRHLAWWLFTRDQAGSEVTERALIDQTTAFLNGRGFEAGNEPREAAKEFVGFCRDRMWVFSDTGTTASGERLYSFTHRTFLEYFSAEHMAYNCDTPERLADTLAPHVAKNEWEVAAELAVQIKDRTSRLGAQRIYAVLLHERRRRAAKDRSGILQFLARSLRSVDPSPETVRELTRKVLDNLFAGDSNDPIRYLPLSWLLASCATSREIVSDEIASRIADIVRSGSTAIRLNGLRLALWMAYGLYWVGTDGPRRLAWDSPLGLFWQACGDEQIRTYADAIAVASANDDEMRYAALICGIITVDRALQMPGGLAPLFQRQSRSLSNRGWEPYLTVMVEAVVCGWPTMYRPTDNDGAARAINELTVVGRYLIDHPRTPWLTWQSDMWPVSFLSGPIERDIPRSRLDPVAYLGAAGILLITSEEKETRALPDEGPQKLGPLSDLYPYIARRWGAEPENELPELPVPEEFRQVFRDWADGKVNFVGQAEAGEGMPVDDDGLSAGVARSDSSAP